MKASITFLVLIFFFTILHPNRNNETVPLEKSNCTLFTQPAITCIPEKSKSSNKDIDVNVKAETGKSSFGKPKKKEAPTQSLQSADYYFVWIVL
jgi:hypothetical protein